MAPIVGGIVYAAVQIFCIRVLKYSLAKASLIAYFIGLLGAILYETGFGAYATDSLDYLFVLVINAVTYTCLILGYFVVIGLSISLRVRILYLLSLSDNGLSNAELSNKFNGSELLERRIQRLLQSGQISEMNGKFHVRPSLVLVLAKLNTQIKHFLIGKTSELD
jgi:hypothetical protein